MRSGSSGRSFAFGRSMDSPDAKRTAWLEREGYCVIRFWNNEVLGNIEGVVDAFAARCGADEAMATTEAQRRKTNRKTAPALTRLIQPRVGRRVRSATRTCHPRPPCGGGSGWGVISAQVLAHYLQHTIGVLRHVIVPESDHAKAL